MRDVLGLGFEEEKLVEPRHRPLDSAGQDRLAPDEGANQQVGIGKPPPDTGELTQGLISLGELARQSEIEPQRLGIGRKRRPLKGPLVGRSLLQASWSVSGEILRAQVAAPARYPARLKRS